MQTLKLELEKIKANNFDLTDHIRKLEKVLKIKEDTISHMAELHSIAEERNIQEKDSVFRSIETELIDLELFFQRLVDVSTLLQKRTDRLQSKLQVLIFWISLLISTFHSLYLSDI